SRSSLAVTFSCCSLVASSFLFSFLSFSIFSFFFFFFNDTATTEIYTLSLHDALPISLVVTSETLYIPLPSLPDTMMVSPIASGRSEEHTSELQSRENLVCRLLLEKKKKKKEKKENVSLVSE